MRLCHILGFLHIHLGLCVSITGYCASTRETSVSVPAVWNGFGYLFNVSVGSPPQPLTVLSDWTWMSLFVRSGRCMNEWNVPKCVGDNGQSFFNEKLSGTFQNKSLPQLSWDTTAFGPNFTVDYATDTVCVVGVCTKDSILQVSDFPYPGSAVSKVPFGGIYGMAPVTPSLGEAYYTANYQAWKRGQYGPKVGWHSCETLSSRESCLGGEAKFVLGGTDSSMYSESGMQTFKIQNPPWLSDAFYPHKPETNNYWSTPVTGVWILGGRDSQNFAPNSATLNGSSLPTLGVLDEGSEGLGAPMSLNAYKRLVSQVNGTLASPAIVEAIMTQGSSGYNGATQDWYTVPCHVVDQAPDLVYELDGRQNYTISGPDYVTKLQSLSAPICYLNVNVWKFGRTAEGDARVLLLGLAFFRRLYVQLDFQSLSFGLAPLLHK